MTSYAIAQLRDVSMNDELISYLEGIDATLAPFGGSFLVHGGPLSRVEGDWPAGDLIIIAFPDRAALDGWYASPAYQNIVPLRTNNAAGNIVFVDGVEPSHRATDILRAEPDTPISLAGEPLLGLDSRTLRGNPVLLPP